MKVGLTERKPAGVNYLSFKLSNFSFVCFLYVKYGSED